MSTSVAERPKVKARAGEVAEPINFSASVKSEVADTAKTVPSQQCGLPGAQIDSLAARFDHAKIILQTLVHVFGGDAETDDPCAVPGLHGVVQNVQWLLCRLHQEIMEVDGELPYDLRWRTFDASELINLIEHLEFNNKFEFSRWHTHWTCGNFDTALFAVETAIAALNQVERTHA